MLPAPPLLPLTTCPEHEESLGTAGVLSYALRRHLQELLGSLPPKHACNKDDEESTGLESPNYIRLRQEGYQESKDSLV